MLLVDVVVDWITEDVISLLISFHNEKWILKVYEILGGVPLACKLAVSECWQISGLVGLVLNVKSPILEGLSQGNEICSIGVNSGIIGTDDGVSRAVTTYTLVLIERLSNRLPWSWPIILGIVISQIEISSGLIHGNRIETQAHESALCSWTIESITSRIVCDDCTVFGGSEIVAPRSRCVRSVYNILVGIIIKMSKLHSVYPFRYILFLPYKKSGHYLNSIAKRALKKQLRKYALLPFYFETGSLFNLTSNPSRRHRWLPVPTVSNPYTCTIIFSRK